MDVNIIKVGEILDIFKNLLHTLIYMDWVYSKIIKKYFFLTETTILVH